MTDTTVKRMAGSVALLALAALAMPPPIRDYEIIEPLPDLDRDLILSLPRHIPGPTGKPSRKRSKAKAARKARKITRHSR